MDLEGNQIIVTGAANGIGKALVQDLSNRGSKIAAVDISEPDLIELKDQYPAICQYVCDISDGSAVQNMMNQITTELDSINILINNAGIMHSAPLVKMVEGRFEMHDFDEWDKVLSTNLNGYFYLTSCVVKQMVQNRIKGVIINVSSISAQGNAGQSAYAASKAGVEALTKTWAKELGYLGIRSAAIAPGFIDTPGTRTALSEETLKSWQKKSPAKRLGTIEEVVKAVNMIIENDFFNGRVLQLDGGLVM